MNWREHLSETDTDPDDERLPYTPRDVTMALGFDPADVDENGDDVVEAVANEGTSEGARKGWEKRVRAFQGRRKPFVGEHYDMSKLATYEPANLGLFFTGSKKLASHFGTEVDDVDLDTGNFATADAGGKNLRDLVEWVKKQKKAGKSGVSIKRVLDGLMHDELHIVFDPSKAFRKKKPATVANEDGKPCGDSFIAADKTCRVDGGAVPKPTTKLGKQILEKVVASLTGENGYSESDARAVAGKLLDEQIDLHKENESDALKEARADDAVEDFWDNSASEIAESVHRAHREEERLALAGPESLKIVAGLRDEINSLSNHDALVAVVLKAESLHKAGKLLYPSALVDIRTAVKKKMGVDTFTLFDKLKIARAKIPK